MAGSWNLPCDLTFGGILLWYKCTWPKRHPAQKFCEWKLGINVNQEEIFRVNWKILMRVGCSNCFSHWTSLGALIILVFEGGMNFPASWEQQQQKFPQQTPGCRSSCFLLKRADRILFSRFKSYQQYWTIRLQGTVVNGCSWKAWKLTKAILVGPGREGDGEDGGWEEQFRSGEGDLEGLVSQIVFKEKRFMWFAEGLRMKCRPSWCSFFYPTITFSGTFLLG